MALRRIPVLSIFAVPVTAAAVALYGNSALEGSLRDAFATAYPGSPIDLSTYCRIVGGQDSGCELHAALDWIPPLALATIVIAILTVALIAFAVSSGGRDPYRIARIFRPVLLATIAAALVLAVLDGTLIILAAWYGEPAITGYRHPFVAFAAGAAVSVAVIATIRSVIRSSGSSHKVFGDAVTRADQPKLWATVDAVAGAVGTQSPDNIVLGITPEMFVTQTEVRSLSGSLKGRTLYLSLPLTRMLDQDELRAIIGHELGHFYGNDLEISARFYPIYGRATSSLLAVVGASRSEIVAQVALASAVGTLRYFLMSLATAERAMARDREILADRAGAHVSSARAMASALVKITAYTPVCDRLLQSLPHTDAVSGPVESVGEQLVRVAGPAGREVRAEALDRVKLPHPTDTHPPLGVRLEALGTTAQSVLAGGLAVIGPAATDLIADAASRDSSLATRLAEADHLKPSTARPLRPAPTGDASIDAGWSHPAVNRAVEFLRVQRGGSLTWILLPRDRWVAIDDLLVGPQPDAPAFRILASTPTERVGERRQIIDLADPDAPADEVLRSGTRLDLVGVVNRGITAATMDEIVFSPINGKQAGRLLSVGIIGRSPVHLGLAGSLIVPSGDPLISDQTRKNELLDLIEAALDEVDGLTGEQLAP